MIFDHFISEEETIAMIFNQEGSFNYYTSEELQAHVVELPYQVRKNRQIMANQEEDWQKSKVGYS